MLNRHCIVVPPFAFEGPSPVGTAALRHIEGLARWLVEEECEVTYLHLESEPGDVPAGVRLATLPTPHDMVRSWPHCEEIRLSKRVADYLARHPFDCIHFQDLGGLGMVPLQRRETLGLSGEPQIVTHCHGGKERDREMRGDFGEGTLQELLADHAERYSVQLADAVVVPSDEVSTWATSHGWELPRQWLELPFFQPETEAALRPQWSDAFARLRRLREPEPIASKPRLTVCIAHYNHGAYFADCLDSLANQTHGDFDLVAIDDGSTDVEARETFERMHAKYGPRSWKFVSSNNRGPSAARNHAASLATTELLLFVDSDNLPHPHMIASFLEAAARSGRDVISCYFQVFENDPPSRGGEIVSEYHAVGGCLEAGMLTNVFGDTNCLIRASVFQSSGGFNEERGSSFEDWEYLANLSLAGHSFGVIPDHLFLYRHLTSSFSRRESSYANHQRALRPYLDPLPFWQRRVLLAHFASQGPFRPPWQAEMEALESKVTTLHQKLAQLEEKREQDRERMDKYKAKIANLKEAVYERSRNPWLLWLRRFFAPAPRSVVEEEGR